MATITSLTGSRSWNTDADWVGGAKPADGDTVVIAANCQMLMNFDASGYTGFAQVTISGDATTPGMLYFANGTSGYLKIRTANNLIGTTGAAKGRLLANSDGVWGHTTPLAFANKAIIELGATSSIVATYLDIALYGTNPTYTSVRTYGTKYDFTAGAGTVDTVNDTIDLGVTPPSAGTAVMITTASGSLPGGLIENCIYYIRGISGTKCKLALQNADAQIVDITSVGSGTCTVFSGHTNTSTATMNVLDDVTADTPWVTTAGYNRAFLVSGGPQNYDQQRATLSTITSTQITLSANVDSVQYPGARIGLSSRNVSIRSTCTTSVNIVDYSNATTSSGVLQCEIVATAGSGTTFYGTGVNSGTGHTVSGTVMGCTIGVNSGTGHTVSGTVMGCTTLFSFNAGAGEGLSVIVGASANITPLPPTTSGRNTVGAGGTFRQGAFFDAYNKVADSTYDFLMFGDVIKKTAIVRSGGASWTYQVVPQSNCAIGSEVLIFERKVQSVPAVAQNKSIWIRADAAWSPYPTAAQLYVEAEYISNGTTLAASKSTSTAVLSDGSSWVEFAIPQFTPAAVGSVVYRGWLKTYQASRSIYVDIGALTDTVIIPFRQIVPL